jgi:hypothetical protein
MRGGFLVSLALLAALPVACGGRYDHGEGDDGGTSTSGGAGSNQGASASMGAKSGKAGAASTGGAGIAVGGGISTVAGAGTVGGSVGVGGSCACPAIACGPGTYPVPNPNGCCFHCEPFGMPCPTIGCAPGYHPEQLPGQMCLTCVQDSCADQRKYYESFKAELLEKYSSAGCMLDQDCATWWEKNQCAVACGIAVPVSALNNLDSNLQSYAQQHCSPMCQGDVPPCAPLPNPICVQGICQYL